MAVTLRTALGSYGTTAPLRDGRLQVDGATLAFEDFASILVPIRAMCRTLAFDVCEMPLVTYMVAKAVGTPFTAMPLFVQRRFPQRAIFTAGIRHPKDLEGKLAGARAYTDTTGVWSRAVLSMMHGVDLDAISWLVSDEEHVAEFSLPSNVKRVPDADLLGMLSHGEIQATVNIPSSSTPRDVPAGVGRLFADAAAEERAWYDRTGIYPPSHTVVIRDDVLEAHPWLPDGLFQAFVRSWEIGMADLQVEGSSALWERELLENQALLAGRPLAHGLAANRYELVALIELAHAQHILTSKPRPEDLFLALD